MLFQYFVLAVAEFRFFFFDNAATYKVLCILTFYLTQLIYVLLRLCELGGRRQDKILY